MRINRNESIWIDEFENESQFQGVLNLANEFDDSGAIYIRIGSKTLGFIDVDELVAAAEQIIELWKTKESKP